jgi:hypothetical protein
MIARINDRLRLLEEKTAPKGRHFVFAHFVDGDDPDAPSRDERLAVFKAEQGVTHSDTIHEVSINFA